MKAIRVITLNDKMVINRGNLNLIGMMIMK